LKVKDNKLIVKKSPDIGWLALLYPDVSEFYVTFPEVQGIILLVAVVRKKELRLKL